LVAFRGAKGDDPDNVKHHSRAMSLDVVGSSPSPKESLMKQVAIAGFALVLMGSAVLRAQQPAPQKERECLRQLAGEWEYDAEAALEPGKPPMKIKGTENARRVGDSWVVGELKATIADAPFTGIMTLGFDDQKKKFVGAWIDSMHSHLVQFEGTADAAGKTLTLFAEGPNPSAPGKPYKYKEVIEIKSKDHKIHVSSLQGEDGKWSEFMTANYRRKK
jgi:hypothetical protein